MFAPWGDYRNYLLVPGGAFEAGTPAWALSGGAKVMAGNEPFYVRSKQDKNSLYLPNGSSALSPTVCFGLGDWHARFFVRNVGSTSGKLKVDVTVKSLLGVVSLLDGGSCQWDRCLGPIARHRSHAHQRVQLARRESGLLPLPPHGHRRSVPGRRRLPGSLEKLLAVGGETRVAAQRRPGTVVIVG